MARMKRRDFVKALVAVPAAARAMLGGRVATAESAAAVSSPTAAAGTVVVPSMSKAVANFDYRTQMLAASVPDTVAATQGHFFNAQQMATLRRLGDLFQPAANGYPGATQAGTPEFLDFLIGASPAERKTLYLAGLDRLNTEAHKEFGKPFAEVNAEEADKLIRPWLRAWMNDHPPTEPYARFMNLAHAEIRTATMNSEAWSVAATSSGERAPGIGQYWSPIDPDIQIYV